MADEKKSILKSRTLWINIVVVAIAVLTSFEQMLSTGQAVTLMGVANIFLRAITTKAVAMTIK